MCADSAPRRNISPTWLPTVKIAPAQGWNDGDQPQAGRGFAVNEFARDLDHPRWFHVLPNGDVLVAETNGPKREGGGIVKRVQAWLMLAQAAEQRGVFAFGQASDMSSFAPKAHLTAIVDDWSGYYIKRVREVMDGSWKTGDVWGGIKDGMVKIAPYNAAVTPAARAAADEVLKGIVAGTLHPFTGELKDQKGEVRLKAGETASDAVLSKMDWYVEGVQA